MLKFKRIVRKDYQAVVDAWLEFGIDLGAVLKDKVVLAAFGGRREIFITGKGTYKILDAMKKNPYFAGLFIGETKNGRFIPSLEGATLMAPHTKKKIVVNKKAEQLVLYGRDVLLKSVLDSPGGLSSGDTYLIVNERDELLGIGRIENDVIKNLMDRGWYLRKGG